MVIHIISQRSIKVAKMLAYFLNEGQKDFVKENNLQGPLSEELTVYNH